MKQRGQYSIIIRNQVSSCCSEQRNEKQGKKETERSNRSHIQTCYTYLKKKCVVLCEMHKKIVCYIFMLLKFNFTTQVIVHEMKSKKVIEENMNNNSSSTTITIYSNGSIRNWHIHYTLMFVVESPLCREIYNRKKTVTFFDTIGQQAGMTWIPFYNRSSLLLNFTRNEFGNGTSTVKHDYQIRLFQVILNFMNRSCTVSHTKKPITILN